jgi:serine/threonine-protein kinase
LHVTPERHQQIGDLYHRALEMPAERRAAFLAAACADDEQLRQEVSSLLAAHSDASGFLTSPALHVAARTLAGAAHDAEPPRTIGHYEIRTLLGVGGMGEVYRAHDVRLGRDVALKLLPDRLASDPHHLARFDREARLLASLNHPNIAALYGLDTTSGRPALVLELVEGTTLAERLSSAPIPVREALDIARQIADALEAAHEHGIVHRDLKPANISIRADGTVKVLDFGLAKAFDSAADVLDGKAAPVTLTDPAGDMGPGTPAYMSPEQARGQAVDRRTDMWAFGCVLFEMLTGERAFAGDRTSDVLARILERAPALDLLPAHTPAAIHRLVRRCLEKNPDDRSRSAGDAALEIREALRPDTGSPAITSGRSRVAIRDAILYVAAGAAVAGIGVTIAMRPAPAPEPSVVSTSITGPALAGVDIAEGDRLLAIARDGTRVVFSGNQGTQLFIRALDQLRPTALTAPSLSARAPFMSPDGQWVGFVEANFTLRKVPISGGEQVTIATMDGASRGATWTPDDTIIFATSNTTTGLQRVAAGGGAVSVLTRPDSARGESDHVTPEVLPGGRAVLMTILPVSGRLEEASIAVVDLATGAWGPIVRGGYNARYLTGGVIVYVARNELQAVGFDLERLQTRGAPQPVVTDIATVAGAYGIAHFDVATNGTLAYLDAARSVGGRALVWVDRSGHETPIDLPPRPYAIPRISPDGTRVALYVRDPGRDLWVLDLGRRSSTRLTFGPDIDAWPVWLSNDRLLFGSQRTTGAANVFLQRIGAPGSVQQLTEGIPGAFPTAVVPGGREVVVSRPPVPQTNTGWELGLLPLASRAPGESGGDIHLLDGLNTRFNERNGVVSPDGRWLAYDADSLGGRFEVFVRPFPNVGAGLWQISTGGGHQPVWAPGGRELFYLSLTGAMMAVAIDPQTASFSSPSARQLFAGDYVMGGVGNVVRHYDLSQDGQRFLMLKETGSVPNASNQIVVVQNWGEQLRRMFR